MFINLWKNKKGGAAGIVIGIFITIAVIGALIGGAYGYLINTTPEKLGIADEVLFEGESFRTLGFADMKFKDIIKQFKELTKADTSQVVQNEPTEQDKTAADGNLSGASNTEVKGTDGKTDYTALISTQLVYDERYLKTYTDTQLAYIFNQILNGTIEKSSSAGEDGVKYLQQINAAVNEISLTASGSAYKLRVVMSINTSSLTAEIKAAMGAAYSLFKNAIPEVVYVVSYFDVTADADTPQKVKLISENIKINDTENAVSKALFKVLASTAAKAGQDVSGMTENEQKAVINDTVGDAFETVVYNLGDLGITATANVEANGKITDTAAIEYGAGGITAGKLYIVTRKAA